MGKKWEFGLLYDLITTDREFTFEKHIAYLLLFTRVHNTDKLCLEIYIPSILEKYIFKMHNFFPFSILQLNG